MACLRTTTVNGHCFTNGNTCIDNVGFGTTLFSNMNGTSRYNTAIGVGVLGATTSQCRINNTAVGCGAINSVNACLNNNTSIGYKSLARSVNATAVGFYASAYGTDALAVGHSAQASNLYSVAIGRYAQASQKSVAVGCAAIANSAENITAIGTKASAQGSRSTVIGYYAVDSGGNYSTTIGVCATGSGEYSIVVGSKSSSSGGNNNIVLGYNITASGDGNIFFNTNLGSGPNTIYTKWSYNSDCRDKTKIEPLGYNLGLPLVKKLKPVTFRWDLRDHYVRKCGFERGVKDGTLKRPELQLGILAQDLDVSLQELNERFDALKLDTDKEKYSLTEGAFVSSLVKSIQQLTNRLDVIKTRIENLETV